ncbi:Ommochrome-binding protein [Eumeta japonica]|uniref:Ommochrome-binding protein n=1 Tax=Eumeta variegata TaxID=151549 RepID=A0A4C1Y9P4_EUMVA|nr:Ommochrome-binding protein [Eumeta japonica]
MPNSNCNGVLVNRMCHEIEVLAENMGSPEHLIVDFHTNVLYFSNFSIVEDILNYSCYLDLNTMELAKITQPALSHGYTQAVDQDEHEVYISDIDNIYKFFYNNKTVERVATVSGIIDLMFYKDALYYSTYSQNFYTLINGESVEVEFMKINNTKILAIDKDGYVFIRNDNGLYGKPKGSKYADRYKESSSQDFMAIDVNGLPYLSNATGVYFVNKGEKTLEKISDFISFNGFAFDKDNNMIFSDSERIIRLKLKTEV